MPASSNPAISERSRQTKLSSTDWKWQKCAAVLDLFWAQYKLCASSDTLWRGTNFQCCRETVIWPLQQPAGVDIARSFWIWTWIRLNCIESRSSLVIDPLSSELHISSASLRRCSHIPVYLHSISCLRSSERALLVFQTDLWALISHRSCRICIYLASKDAKSSKAIGNAPIPKQKCTTRRISMVP